MHQDGDAEPNLEALFTFVARDPASGKATRVNPLQPQTAQEQHWFDERQLVAEQRKLARKALKAGTVAHEADLHAHARNEWTQKLLGEAEVMRVMPGALACWTQ